MAFIARKRSGAVGKSSASSVKSSPTYKAGVGANGKSGYEDDTKGFSLSGLKSGATKKALSNPKNVPNGTKAMDLQAGAEEVRLKTKSGKKGVPIRKSAKGNALDNNKGNRSGAHAGSSQNPQGGKSSAGLGLGKGGGKQGSFGFGSIKPLGR